MYIPKELTSIENTRLIGYWNNDQTPVYEVTSIHGLNQIIGYIKHTNADYGTVLYRGQARLHEKLIPSILHGSPDKTELKKRNQSLKKYVNNILSDEKMNTLLHFDESTSNREFYKRYVAESMLQHYGFRTHFQDFVDNHWTALWFGLYELKKQKIPGSPADSDYYEYFYERRSKQYDVAVKAPECLTIKEPVLSSMPAQPTLYPIIEKAEYTLDIIGDQKNAQSISKIEDNETRCAALDKLIEKDIREKARKNQQLMETWQKKYGKIKSYNDSLVKKYELDKESNTAYVYILLYVADTRGENFKGVYAGTETITIDLRKALPSVLLRPCAQHGWTVSRIGTISDLSDGVVCVFRLTVELVDKMMGEGLLVQPENFFPPAEVDNGYKILLGRENVQPFETPAKKYPRDLPSLFPFGAIQHFKHK